MAAFSVSLATLAEKMGARLEDVTQKATLDLFASVVRRSPVDSGRFRANWNVSYGAPELAAVIEGPFDPSRPDREVLRAARLPAGGVVYLSNGMPYAQRLEYGWSKQAASGMVRVAAAEFSLLVQEAAAT